MTWYEWTKEIKSVDALIDLGVSEGAGYVLTDPNLDEPGGLSGALQWNVYISDVSM